MLADIKRFAATPQNPLRTHTTTCTYRLQPIPRPNLFCIMQVCAANVSVKVPPPLSSSVRRFDQQPENILHNGGECVEVWGRPGAEWIRIYTDGLQSADHLFKRSARGDATRPEMATTRGRMTIWRVGATLWWWTRCWLSV